MITPPHVLLAARDHRPWPMPEGAWVMAQSWLDLLFAHWPVPIDALRERLPEGLEVDTYDGEAWIGVVPFRMEGVRPRWVPAMPWLSAFPELNVRTYVTLGGKPGVYFFSLEATNPVAVAVARATYKLPYMRAEMSLRDDGDWIHYTSRRTHRGEPPAAFQGRYRPVGEVYMSEPGTLERWLTERYCLYTVTGRGRVARGEIHHPPWPLQRAEAVIEVNTMLEGHGLPLADTAPLLHFARRIDTVVWPIQEVRE